MDLLQPFRMPPGSPAGSLCLLSCSADYGFGLNIASSAFVKDRGCMTPRALMPNEGTWITTSQRTGPQYTYR